MNNNAKMSKEASGIEQRAGKFNYDPENNKDNLISESYLESISINRDEVIPLVFNYDYSVFRDKPLIKCEKNRYAIFNQTFLIEKLFNSLYFDFQKIATEKLSLKGFENEYKENFFEKSLLVKYLENINKEGRYFSLSSQQMADICKNRGEPDYYLKNNAGDVILFEHKDIKISGKIKQSGDLELIVSEYKNKLLRKKKSNKKDLNNPKPVGIGQLVTSVNKIGNGDFVWDTDLDHHAVIYPVIILTDSNFIPDGFPFQMNYWFQEELEKDNVVNINIMPLVVMTTSTLLLYSKHFIQNGIEYYH